MSWGLGAYAINRDEKVRNKVLQLNRLHARTISGDFYENNRFPAYCYDKLICGLMDAHRLAGDPDAYRILEPTTNTAWPHLPGVPSSTGGAGGRAKMKPMRRTSPAQLW